MILLHANNKGADQPAHLYSLIIAHLEVYVNAWFLQNSNILATSESAHLTVATSKTDSIILYTNMRM